MLWNDCYYLSSENATFISTCFNLYNLLVPTLENSLNFPFFTSCLIGLPTVKDNQSSLLETPLEKFFHNSYFSPSFVAISYFFLEHLGISLTMLTTLCALDPSVG